MKVIKCKKCNGSGQYPDHNSNDPHENGCSSCPVAVQCEDCRAEGEIEVADDYKEPEPSKSKTDDLPF